MKLVIGFITYNNSSTPYLPHFLPSLKAALSFLPSTKTKVLAFDNSDEDFRDNENLITDFSQENKELDIEKIISLENLGFGASYNKMIERAKELQADYFLVINSDVLLQKDSIQLLYEALEKNNKLASVCPRLMAWDFSSLEKTEIIDSLGISLSPGLKFSDIGQGQIYNEKNKELLLKEKLLAGSGAAALFKMSALEKIVETREGRRQYFDERFFMYKEDCDLGLRMKEEGLLSEMIVESVIYHDRSAKLSRSGFMSALSSRKNKSQLVKAWSFRNQHFIFLKHFAKQSFFSKTVVVLRITALFLYSLCFERFLLKEYQNIRDFKSQEKAAKKLV